MDGIDSNLSCCNILTMDSIGELFQYNVNNMLAEFIGYIMSYSIKWRSIYER